MSSTRRALLALALGTLGCANHVTLAAAPADPAPRRAAIPSALVIDWIELRRAGFAENPSTKLIANCAESFRSSATFEAVYEPRRAYAAPPESHHLGIRLDETFDPHAAATGTKVVLTFLTGVFPGTLVPYYLDDRIVVEGELRTPLGTKHTYRVERAASVRSFLLFGLAHAERDLRARVFGAALRSLAAAVAADEALHAEGIRAPEVSR